MSAAERASRSCSAFRRSFSCASSGCGAFSSRRSSMTRRACSCNGLSPNVLQRLEAREELRELIVADLQLLLRLHQRVGVEHPLDFGRRHARSRRRRPQPAPPAAAPALAPPLRTPATPADHGEREATTKTAASYRDQLTRPGPTSCLLQQTLAVRCSSPPFKCVTACSALPGGVRPASAAASQSEIGGEIRDQRERRVVGSLTASLSRSNPSVGGIGAGVVRAVSAGDANLGRRDRRVRHHREDDDRDGHGRQRESARGATTTHATSAGRGARSASTAWRTRAER